MKIIAIFKDINYILFLGITRSHQNLRRCSEKKTIYFDKYQEISKKALMQSLFWNELNRCYLLFII